MWERFSYYGMRALLILFMTAAPAAGGLGFDTATAGAIYGLYTSMVYLTTLPGGWVADRLIGAQRAVLYGGILIAAGHFSMAVPSLAMFYLGLTLIVIGTGLLKGNVSVIVGRLYSLEDARRDAGYSIFYMGINTGAFVAPLVCGYLGQRVDWHLGFAAAGVGMTIGLDSVHVRPQASRRGRPAPGRRRIARGVGAPEKPGGAVDRPRRSARSSSSAIGAYTGIIPVTPTQVADAAGYFLLGLIVVFFGWLFFSPGWTPRGTQAPVRHRRALPRRGAVLVASSSRRASTLNLFADRDTQQRRSSATSSRAAGTSR